MPGIGPISDGMTVDNFARSFANFSTRSDGKSCVIIHVQKSTGIESNDKHSISIQNSLVLDSCSAKLGADVSHLETELRSLDRRVIRNRKILRRIRQYVRFETLPFSDFIPEEVFQFYEEDLSADSHRFLYNQQLNLKYQHWDHWRMPLLLTRCGKEVNNVLRTLYKLPSLKYIKDMKSTFRSNPDCFDNCPIVEAIVKRQRLPTNLGSSKSLKKEAPSTSISEYLKNLIHENERDLVNYY